MISQKLYIEGKEVDMSTEPITLQYRSNLLSDIDRITSSNSLMIRLPKTPRNSIIFNFADTLFTSGIERKWYSAVFYRNGVQLIKGKVALLSADREAYELCLVWGIFDKLEEWFKSDDTLRDLPLNYPVQLKKITSENIYATEQVAYGTMYYYNGGMRYVFPVVSVGLIFSRIMMNVLINGQIDTSEVDTSVLSNYYLNFNDNLVDELVQASNEPTFLVKDWIPAIKTVDFFKAICHIFGWYLESTPEGIKLVDYNTATDKSRAVNWSDKVVSYGDVPESITFKYADYAQRNWMRYKPDDSVSLPTNADGSIDIADKTLDNDKTLFTLPFASSYKDEIIQYRVVLNEDDVKEVEFVKTEPRIMGLLENTTAPWLYFVDALKFSNIIADKYSAYSAMLASPTVVEVQLRLDEFDLLGLDFTRPVYLARYMSYFVIIDIQSTGNTSTAKLLKLV